MRLYKFGVLAIIALLAIAAFCCSSPEKVTTVSARTFEKGIEEPGAQIVDVRDASEFDSGHINGAKNINVDDTAFTAKATAELSKDKPVYVYCRGGRRSKEAADILAEKGFKVVNLDGGINCWMGEGLPVVGAGVTDSF